MQELTAIHEQLKNDIYDRLNKIFETVQEITAPEEDADGFYIFGWDDCNGVKIQSVSKTKKGVTVKKGIDKKTGVCIKTEKYSYSFDLTSLPTDDKLTVLEFCETYKK